MKIYKQLGVLIFSFSLALPIPQRYTSWTFALMVLNVLLMPGSLTQFRVVLKDKLFIIFSLFFLIDGLHALFLGGFYFREAKIPFAIIPFLFLIKKEHLNQVSRNIFIAFLAGVLCYIFYAWSYAVYFYTVKYPNYELSLFDGYLVYLFDFHLPGAIHHNYIGLYIAFATLVVYAHTAYFRTLNQVTGLALTAFLSFNMFFIGSKSTSIMLLLLIVVITLLSLRKKIQKDTVIKSAAVLLLLIVGAVVSMRSWLPHSMASSSEKRVGIYTCGLDVIAHTFVFGVGFRNIQESAAAICSEYKVEFFPHNVFIYETISNGIAGVLLLIVMLGFLFKHAYDNNKIMLLSFMILIVSISLIEDVLVLQRGATFFAFFATLLYIVEQKTGMTFTTTKHKDAVSV